MEGSPFGRILTHKSEIKSSVAFEAVTKTWSFIVMMLPVQCLSSVASQLAEFFLEQEKKHEQ